jgi:hypothetical protein
VPPLAPCYELTVCQKELGRGMFCAGFRTTAATLYACEGYRLPTDAEREYAARAGTRTAFYTGDITERDTEDCGADPLLSRIAWYCANAKGQTHPVEQLEANGWGLFDMAGNALEWVNDGYRGQPSEGGSDPGGGGQCCMPTGGPGCGDPTIEQCLCAIDDYCCTTDWDDQCVAEVTIFGCGICF